MVFGATRFSSLDFEHLVFAQFFEVQGVRLETAQYGSLIKIVGKGIELCIVRQVVRPRVKVKDIDTWLR